MQVLSAWLISSHTLAVCHTSFGPRLLLSGLGASDTPKTSLIFSVSVGGCTQTCKRFQTHFSPCHSQHHKEEAAQQVNSSKSAALQRSTFAACTHARRGGLLVAHAHEHTGRTVEPRSGGAAPLSLRLKSPADFLNCASLLVSPLAAASGSPKVVPARPGGENNSCHLHVWQASTLCQRTPHRNTCLPP